MTEGRRFAMLFIRFLTRGWFPVVNEKSLPRKADIDDLWVPMPGMNIPADTGELGNLEQNSKDIEMDQIRLSLFSLCNCDKLGSPS